jgi:hypothetical protein
VKQAVVILHGMGEQIPMQTLESFVEAVWTTDKDLVSAGKPDPDSGLPRHRNASWGKPDARNHSYELRRITTEESRDGGSTEFFEYYWADLMHGTTWEQVQAWILDLLWRNPLRRVPRPVLAAWLVLWAIALCVIGVVLAGMVPGDPEARPSALRAILGGLGALALSAFVSNVLVKRFGDVARYVKAKPPNVARRQEIRSNGVALLEKLMNSTAKGKPEYDRLIVVAHSLGTIVAYDILTQLFARHNSTLATDTPAKMPQPERDAMERMIRRAGGLAVDRDAAPTEPQPLDIDAFQDQQARCLAEAHAQGSPWIISDFITLGSPLTHAEFLLADSREDLRARQASRVLPVCPPVLEYDGGTKLMHFSYGPAKDPTHRRIPHHAALFAYTRWTNLYSDQKMILSGDLISGPLAQVFGLCVPSGSEATVVAGIRDIAVLPELDEAGKPVSGARRRLLTHNHYWDLSKGDPGQGGAPPAHIAALRKALRLLR